MTISAITSNRREKDEEFLVGAEDGCCGLLAIAISMVAMDKPRDLKSPTNKRRILSRALTIGIQVPILVVTCSSLSIINGDKAWDYQRTSVFVLIVVLMLHLINLVENVSEIVLSAL